MGSAFVNCQTSFPHLSNIPVCLEALLNTSKWTMFLPYVKNSALRNQIH